MKIVIVLVAIMVMVASAPGLASAQSGNLTTANNTTSECYFCEALKKTLPIFEARDTLPEKSVIGQPERYDLPTSELLALVPNPAPGNIQIDIDGSDYDPTGKYTSGGDIGWTGNIMYGDGDTVSYDGIGISTFLMKCVEGQHYALNFNKENTSGLLKIYIFDHEGHLLDDGQTDAAYGVVSLVGTC